MSYLPVPLLFFPFLFHLTTLQILGITLDIRSNPIISIWSSFSKGNWLHCICTQVCPGGKGECRGGLASSNDTSNFPAMFLPGAACIWHYTKSPDLKLGFMLESSGEPLMYRCLGLVSLQLNQHVGLGVDTNSFLGDCCMWPCTTFHTYLAFLVTLPA